MPRRGILLFNIQREIYEKIHQTKASAIIVSPKLKESAKGTFWCWNNPYLAFAKSSRTLDVQKPAYTKGIDNSLPKLPRQ